MDNVASLISCAVAGAVNLLNLRVREYAAGAILAGVIFFGIGTAMELWAWPVRMSQLGGFEVKLLVLQSLVIGLYFGIRHSSSGQKAAGAGSLLALLGIACPFYSKILLALFGSLLLLPYLEPVHRYVGLLGLLISGLALLWKSTDLVIKQMAADGPDLP